MLTIQRVGNLPFGPDANLFIPWTDISDVRKGEFRASSTSRPMRTIEIGLTQLRNLAFRLDRDNTVVGLPVYALAAEPNTVMSALKFLVDNPGAQPLIARPEALAWFTPPRQSEQQRISDQHHETGSAR